MNRDGDESRRVRGRKRINRIQSGPSSFSRRLVNVVFVAFLLAMAWVVVTQYPMISAKFEGMFGHGGGGGGIGDKLGRIWKGVGNFAPFH